MKKHCHCGAEFDKHEGGEKDGSLHCNNCGCCFLADGETIRPGHSPCADLTAEMEAAADAAKDEVPEPAEPESEPSEPETEAPPAEPEPEPEGRGRRGK